MILVVQASKEAIRLGKPGLNEELLKETWKNIQTHPAMVPKGHKKS
jgi:RNA-binding protein YhbY